MNVTPSLPGQSRRAFVAGLAATTGAVLLGRNSSAQTSPENPRRIDTHLHIFPPTYVSMLKEINVNAAGSDNWTLAKMIEDMDRYGTASGFTSITLPGVWFGNAEMARKIARTCNEYAARLMSDYKGRFGMFAVVPFPDIDGSLREIEYALDTLKADGICMYTQNTDETKGFRDRSPGDPYFNPVHEELNRRKAVVYTHPKPPDCCNNLVPGVGGTMIEYGAATSRCIASLIFSGNTTKFPDTKWVFSHGGGVTPYVLERFLNGTAAEIVPGVITKGQGGTGKIGDNPKTVPNGVLYELRKMYYDCAQCSNMIAMRALRTMVPVSQILFGTDYPFRSAGETGQGLVASGVFNAAELRAVNRENAMRLLPRFRA
jgi:predicted TIM-barrel fold metal-dependent hydrolase